MHLSSWAVTLVACFTAVNAFELRAPAGGFLSKRRTEASPCGHNIAGKDFHHSAKKGCVECGHSAKGQELYLTASKTCVAKCPLGFSGDHRSASMSPAVLGTRKCDHVTKHKPTSSKPAHSSFVFHTTPCTSPSTVARSTAAAATTPGHTTRALELLDLERNRLPDYQLLGHCEFLHLGFGRPVLQQHPRSGQQRFRSGLLRHEFCIVAFHLELVRHHSNLGLKLCFGLLYCYSCIFIVSDTFNGICLRFVWIQLSGI
ncbi:hypothetical protein RQP46_009044 [Phenoliferia psychrophenolica]